LVPELALLAGAAAFLDEREPRDHLFMEDTHVTARFVITGADLVVPGQEDAV
jgi:hypothetical protein